MKASDKIIEILNNDMKARIILKEFNEAVERQGLNEQEEVEARSALIGLLIANNPEAMHTMARDVYESFNQGA